MKSACRLPESEALFRVTATCPDVMLEYWGRLLHAADEYCVPDMIHLCEERILEYMDVYSVSIILRLADDINRRALKKEALTFITHSEARMRDIQQTPSFETLGLELVKEVYECFFNAKCLQKRTRSANEDLSFFERL